MNWRPTRLKVASFSNVITTPMHVRFFSVTEFFRPLFLLVLPLLPPFILLIRVFSLGMLCCQRFTVLSVHRCTAPCASTLCTADYFFHSMGLFALGHHVLDFCCELAVYCMPLLAPFCCEFFETKAAPRGKNVSVCCVGVELPGRGSLKCT